MTIGQSGDMLLADSKQVKFAESDIQLVFSNGPSQGEDVKGLFTLSFSSTGSGVLSCLLYTSPSPRDATLSRMPSSA